MASGSRVPPPISFPDGTPVGEPTEERTVIATVPFELLEQSRKTSPAGPDAAITSPLPADHAPKASPPPVSPLPVLSALDALEALDAVDIDVGGSDPFDVEIEVDLGPARPTPSRSFGVEATGEFRLDELVGREGGTLVIGDPTDIVETSVVRAMSGDGLAVVETRICIGRDVEALLRAGTVLSANPARPRVELSAFETHVLGLLDGHRTVDQVARAAGVSLGDLRIALALLADKSQLAAPARAASGKLASSTPASKPTPTPAASNGSSPWDVPPAPTGVTLPETPSRAFRHALVPRKTDNEVTSTTSALERFVLSRVDGRRTVAELLTHVALDESDLALALDLLEQRGLITLEMAPTPAPAPTRTRIPTPPPTGLSVEGLLRMAARLEDADDVERAIPLLKRASEAAPNDASIWNRLGVALARTKDLPGARVAMARALGLNPDDPIVVSNHRRIANLAARAAEAARN